MEEEEQLSNKQQSLVVATFSTAYTYALAFYP